MATKKKTAVKSATARAGSAGRSAAKKAVPAKSVRSTGGKAAAAPKKAGKPAVKTTGKPAAKKPAAPKKPAPKAAPARTRAAVKSAKPSSKKVIAKAASKKAVPEKKPTVKKTVVKERIPLIEKKVAKKEEKKIVKAPKRVVVPKLSTRSSVKYEPDFTKSVLDTPFIEKAPSVMRYSDSDLAEFKEIILRKLDAAKKELAYLQGLITRRDEGGDMDEGRYMTMEDGSVSMEREQLSQLASRQITFIDHLEKALMRVENKTYGICRVTGHLIDKARLRAVPHATLSIEAKSMMNR